MDRPQTDAGLEGVAQTGIRLWAFNLEAWMKLKSPSKPRFDFDVVIEKDEEGYLVATVPALKGCHTQARSLDELMKRIHEAAELCLEVDGPPKGVRQFVGVQRMAV